MFKEVLTIVPKLSSGDMNAMERSLSTRFGSIAKKFGKGLVATLTGGGIAGLALGLIDKLLNPLKETQDAIDRVLKQGDDIVTNAQHFGTTAGKLFRLQALAKSTGLDSESLFMLMEKFQSQIAQATADPNKESAVRNFVGSKDMAEAFFEFIQSLQKMDKTQQNLVQQDVFGEKLILRMADFLQTDFGWQQKLIGGPKSEDMTAPLEHLNRLNDLKDALEANRMMTDTMSKSKEINAGMIKSQDERIRLDLQKENQQIKSYEDLAAISNATAQLANLASDVTLKLTSLLVNTTSMAENMKKLSNSRVVKGFLKWVPGSGD